MGILPYSRTVLVTLSRNDAFPTRRGFGTAMLLQSKTIAGVLDATHRTKIYASMEEVDVDFDSTDAFYIAAQAAFSQNPRPRQIKAAFYTKATAIEDTDLTAELNAIYNADNDFYWIGVEALLRDTAVLDDLVNWVEAKNKIAVIDSNVATMKVANNTTNIAARHKGTVERTSVFYHDDVTEYAGFALGAMLGTFNFDDADSAYTAKYKKLRGVSPVNVASDALTAITGYVPGIGQSLAAGHMANTYIDIGGQFFVVEGSTLTPNVFLDEIHTTDWIVARTEETMLGILLNNKRIAFDDRGMEQLASGAREVMNIARQAGLIANDLDPETQEYAPAVEIIVPSVFDVPASQRKSRVAPAIQVRFRYAGAVHYTTVNYTMNF